MRIWCRCDLLDLWGEWLLSLDEGRMHWLIGFLSAVRDELVSIELCSRERWLEGVLWKGMCGGAS